MSIMCGCVCIGQSVLQGKLNNPRDEDIRTKILRHEDPKDKTTSLFSRAYAKTQPQRIYAEDDEDEEGKKDNDKK